jgi:hypothetical protein
MMIQIGMSVLLLIIVPMIAGTLFQKVNSGHGKMISCWISGHLFLWAGFQLLSVPLILLRRGFTDVVLCYSGFQIVAVLLAVILLLLSRKKVALPAGDSTCDGLKKQEKLCKKTREKEAVHRDKPEKKTLILWGVFSVLLLLQMILGLFLAYEEGDDAFYVSISTSTQAANNMYQILPYSGLSTGLDARHGLAPFPIWIAYLARMAQMPAVSMAQLIVPIVIVGMSYGVFYLLAEHLFAEKRENIPFFMVLMAVLVLFGGYSNYSAENFLLVRATQGKSVVANVILPVLIWLLFVLMARLQKEQKTGIGFWVLPAVTMIAGCLCSTLGGLLTCMMLGVVGICMAVVYRRWKVLLPLVLCCVPPVVFALAYFVLR